jgi:hypothetical protein
LGKFRLAGSCCDGKHVEFYGLVGWKNEFYGLLMVFMGEFDVFEFSVH